MTKHHSHATKKPAAHEIHRHSSERVSHTPKVVHFRPPSETEQKEAASFLTWPSHLFEMLLTPWHRLTPMEAWVENRRAGGKPMFLKAESKETDTAYYYMVELPDVTSDQITLTFQNRVIMLRVEEAEEQRKKGYSYRHARSIRRAFSLPVYTDGNTITAELRGGVLTITIPKTDKPVSPKSRIIEIT